MATASSYYKLHVAILASPGIGHLVPALVLGNRLATHHGVKVTILAMTTNTSAAESQILKQTAPHDQSEALVQVLEVPPVDISTRIDPTTTVCTQLYIMTREAMPGVRSTIAAMDHRPDLLIADLFCTDAFPIAAEFNMPKYVYIPSNACFTALTIYCQVLDKEIEGEYVDQERPLQIPGCKPVQPEDVVDPMLDRSDQSYPEYVSQGIRFTLSDGILMNTWEDLEPSTLKALRENESLRAIVKAPIYPIGPLTRPPEPAGLKGELKEWLDKQASESVLFASFGSGGSLPAQQITELAWGLELSQQRFVWVVRPPAKFGSDKSFFTSGNGSSDGTPEFLPEGFLSRTKGVGLVVQKWVQQVEILSHPSIGGFLSHCGWNSTLESITNGVPMIAWPLYAEQRSNAALLAEEEIGVAARPEVLPTKKVVEREEIEKMIRTVMQYNQGRLMRERIKQLKLSGEKAVSNGGSSFSSICDFLRDAQMRLKSIQRL